jgi:transcriptional regulator with XRE-family HTH domain
MKETDDHPPPPLHRRLRDARRARGITQSSLARQVGCRQSAVSMLESGRMEAVARPTLEKIAKLLDVPLDAGAAAEAPSPPPAPARGRGYCPNGDCPANVPFAVGGELIFWPRRQPADGGRHCVWCGEVLESACRQCGAPVTEGACCPACGAPRIPPPAGVDGDPESWAEARRRQLAALRALLT